MGEALKRLAAVQAALKVPKNQINKFGGYKFRNAEDIMEAAKPLCITNGLLLNVTDSLEHIGDRYYVRATARVFNVDDRTDYVETSAFARESDSKKGMDDSQVTGAASSYARKYALGGLFALDDNKDPDTNEYHEQTNGKPEAEQTYYCAQCSKPITGTAKASAKQIAEYNNKQFGRYLCAACGAAASKAAKAVKSDT
jgi:transposase-like protein